MNRNMLIVLNIFIYGLLLMCHRDFLSNPEKATLNSKFLIVDEDEDIIHKSNEELVNKMDNNFSAIRKAVSTVGRPLLMGVGGHRTPHSCGRNGHEESKWRERNGRCRKDRDAKYCINRGMHCGSGIALDLDGRYAAGSCTCAYLETTNDGRYFFDKKQVKDFYNQPASTPSATP